MIQEEVFNEHKRLHEGVPALQCVYCKLEKPKMSLIKTHIIQAHLRKMLKIEPFQCEYCGKTFITKSRVESHIFYVHRDYRPIECDLCKFKFKSKSHLQRHLVAHVRIHLLTAFKNVLLSFKHFTFNFCRRRQNSGRVQYVVENSFTRAI